jgi:hypothetical protein
MPEELKKLKEDLDAQIRKMDGLDDISREKLNQLVSLVEMNLQKPAESNQKETRL